MSGTDTEKLAAIRARHAAASRGPWRWFGYLRTREVSLEGGRDTVMDFTRWGMSGAQPRWSVKGILEKLADLVVPDTTPGRGRVTDINHPDARFIAASWEDVRDLLGMVDALQQSLREEREARDADGKNLEGKLAESLARINQLTRERDSEMEERWKVSEVKRQQEARAEAAESQRDALQAFAVAFAATAEAAVAHHRRPKTGMQVSFHGDFAGASPSVIGRLEWWAKRAREALTAAATATCAPASERAEWSTAEAPTTPQQHGCPMGDVCPVCDEPEVSRG
ncbi:hypothetical protein [Corallococcus sp. AS-1-6]|uniref:hypothetical protein n=1 Tax=Corallococcus sp. AS-1-6 TaxID=2874599 RepID=UPI001CBE34BA|nr:hypothetical protein [Corallococcus sp. AS-1-6]MBZ4371447.1 hypothetical protein [Corallococcus sp. AS-1-6]